jgi:hypothetical protein
MSCKKLIKNGPAKSTCLDHPGERCVNVELNACNFELTKT